MHQLIELFQGYWLIERYQIAQGGQVHAQQLPIAQMRAQNDHPLP